MVKRAGKDKVKALTTQRVDFETLSKLKTINYHIYKSRGIRLSQAELIRYVVAYVYGQEAEFIDCVSSGKLEPKESTFDTLVRVSGKPWFPYGNLVKVE